jgi:hypothetical protein
MKRAHKLLFENNLHESHWGLRIIEAELNGKFTYLDEVHASKWMSCACGKLDAHIERNVNKTIGARISVAGSPKDEELFSLGEDFSVFVDEDSLGFYHAARMLILIEKRSIELLKESLK